jgi:type IX secretion system substrate protein/CARDB protein
MKYLFTIFQLLIASVSFAQLSGNYIIDPSGQGQYTTFTAAMQDLQTQGVSGLVKFQLVSGVYNEQVRLDSIVGTTDSKRIIIESLAGDPDSVTLRFAATKKYENHIIKLVGTDHITIRNLTFNPIGSQYAYAIRFNGGISDLVIENNVFESDISIIDGGAVFGDPSVDSLIFNFNRNRDIVLRDNLVKEGRNGISITGSFQIDNGLKIENNNFIKVRRLGWILSVDSVQIINNATDTSYQVYEGFSLNSSGPVIEIAYNNFPDLDFGMTIGYPNTTTLHQVRVYNNFISARAQSLSLISATFVDVFFNNFRSKDTPAMHVGFGNDVRSVNNIFMTQDGGAAIFVSLGTEVSYSDYNVYFNLSHDSLLNWGNTGLDFYKDLPSFTAATKLDSHSIEVNPSFKTVSDLHVSAQALQSAGIPWNGVMDDIDGDLRGPVKPDIGADEVIALPNIKPTSLIITPSNAKAGKAISVEWTVTNTGSQVIQGPWRDALYLSSDTILDYGDISLGQTFLHSSSLLPGNNYIQQQSVILPEDSSGQFYILVQIDSDSTLFEDVNDNILAQPISIVIPDRPDLQVDSVIVPGQVYAGTRMGITYYISNKGNVDTDKKWSDVVFMGQDSTYFLNPATFNPDSLIVKTNNNPAGLKSGESYSFYIEINLPVNITGDYYFLLFTDHGDVVSEMQEGLNLNSSVSYKVEILKAQLPDLIVTDIIAPSVMFSGDTVPVVYMVQNIGFEETIEDIWRDYIYISDDSSVGFGRHGRINIQGSKNTEWIGTHTNLNPLGQGKTDTITEYVVVPDCFDGDYFFYVHTDATLMTYESLNLNNLSRSPAREVIIQPKPDLVPTQITLTPAIPASGKTFDFNYTVLNDGFIPVLKGQKRRNQFFISKVDTLDLKKATTLGTAFYDDLIDTQQAVSRTVNLKLPDTAFGLHYFYIMLDAYENICEEPFEQNNVLRFGPVNLALTPPPDLEPVNFTFGAMQFIAGDQLVSTLQLTNTGPGNVPPGNWRNQYYLVPAGMKPGKDYLSYNINKGPMAANTFIVVNEVLSTPFLLAPGKYDLIFRADNWNDVFEHTGEGNNDAIISNIDVTVDSNRLSDLSVSTVQLPGTIYSGRTLTITYEVINGTPADTKASSWMDRIRVKDGNGRNIARKTARHMGIVNGNGKYTVTINLKLPDGAFGNYTLEIEIDSTERVPEYVRGNNLYSMPIVIAPSPTPDFAVENITGNTFARSGQLLSATYTVRNLDQSMLFTESWTDKLYFSRDNILGPDDILWTVIDQNRLMTGNGAYTESIQERVPSTAFGDYLLLVVSDANHDIYEANREINNISASAFNITIDKPNPSDLVPVNMSVQPGNAYTINWTLKNKGFFNVQGSWDDVIYISTDKQWDPDDYKAGLKMQSADTILPGDSRNHTMKAYIPPIPPGYYYFILKVDAFNYIPEVNTVNNQLISADSFFLDPIPEILPDSTYAGKWPKGQPDQYYKIQVPGNKSMLVTLKNTDALFGYQPTELYIRHDLVPDRSRFDYRSTKAFSPDQEVIVPSKTTPRKDFFLSSGNTAPIQALDSLDYSIRAELKDFSVFKVFPDEGGQYGEAVIDIEGFDFDDSTSIMLIQGNDTIFPYHNFFVHSSLIRGHFSFLDKPLGWYNLELTKSTGQKIVADSAFRVLPEGTASPFAQVSVPGLARVGDETPFSVYYGNKGNINVYGQTLVVALFQENEDVQNLEMHFLGDHMNNFKFPDIDLNPPGDSNIMVSDSLIWFMLWLPTLPAQSRGALEFSFKNRGSGGTYVSAFYLTEKLGPFESSGHPELAEYSNTLLFWDSLAAITPAGGLRGGNDCNKEFTFDKMVEKTKEELWGLIKYVGFPNPKGFAQKKITESALNKVGAKGLTPAVLKSKSLMDVSKDPFFKKQIQLLSKCMSPEKIEKCFIRVRDGSLGGSLYHDGYHYVNTCKKKRGSGSDKGKTNWIKSRDPNEIVGPSGKGNLNFIGKDDVLTYTIKFENVSSATSPAQIVRIDNPLNRHFRLQDFRLKEFGFGDTIIRLQPSPVITTTIPLGNAYNNDLLKITGGVNITDTSAFWIFETLDATTGLPSRNPLSGFLPPNDSTGIGEGYVIYDITLKPNTSSGMEIDNMATIKFDRESPLTTNTWVNVTAGNLPESKVLNLPATIDSTSFLVEWEGTDGIPFGAGLVGYEVFARVNQGPYFLWQTLTTNTADVFTGQVDSTYSFFSIAIDSLGVREAVPNNPDATVTILITGIENKTQVEKENWSIYPNPTTGQINMESRIARNGHLTIRLLDIYGRAIKTLYSGSVEKGPFYLNTQTGTLDSGIYLIEIIGSNGSKTRRILKL